MERDFETWLSTFKRSIATYEYFVNFKKVYEKIDYIKIELNILNSLIGSKNIKTDFVNICKDYPKVKRCIPILLAVRNTEINILNDEEKIYLKFSNQLEIDKLIIFMDKTGLFNLLSNHLINNLVDYATGVEVGLDSNARKNRGGTIMENFVEKIISNTIGNNYYCQMKTKTIEETWGIDLSSISNNGKTIKRFDFVVEKNNIIYAFEVNFYNGGGSKLNEVARSYKNIAIESQNIENFKFIWITDGMGWKSARHNLEETFDVMEDIYNINDLQNGILDEILL